ncbi:ribonuclease domain-containing protein [Stenotrophomonas sp. CFBP8980]|uniref:ribonuclease domain-containing protein n=1 Tax=Stenotrophomonas sp. CFBP8980 TaxID=3096523 RepID=UPI002A6B1AB0|nr:ribonuclease domain-containing protein [Stenotrophomonas sp. CFBP8980]MDY1034491.1 ribonuclease domain-containing protein [Stenotrophomonas sp. CFBP8980]
MRNPRLLITAIALLLLGLVGNHFLQRPAKPQFAPSLSGASAPAATSAAPATHAALPGFLPAEARQTIALIQRGGPFPHRQDGSVFGNREQRLPQRERGYYREYTVETPGAGNRGARRIITGGKPPDAWYYTSDHYESFRSFNVPAQGAVP